MSYTTHGSQADIGSSFLGSSGSFFPVTIVLSGGLEASPSPWPISPMPTMSDGLFPMVTPISSTAFVVTFLVDPP